MGGGEGGVLWPQFGLRSIIFIPVLGLEDGDFFFCASQTPLSCVQNSCPPPRTSLPRLTPPPTLAVALAARFSSSSATSSRTISTNVDISGKDIKRLHHFFFFFSFRHHLCSCVLTCHHHFLRGWDTAPRTEAQFMNWGEERQTLLKMSNNSELLLKGVFFFFFTVYCFPLLLVQPLGFSEAPMGKC